MRPLVVETLSVRGFRNLEHVDLALGERFNVLSGDNGQGKTNLLESVYVLATSRSFRTSKPAELIALKGEVATLRGRVREGTVEREHVVGLKRGQRLVQIDGKRPPTLSSYAVQTPTVVFHPGALSLAAGGGAERRKLLDRISLYLSPASLADAQRYGEALRARQRTLEQRGESSSDLDGWEELVVQHGTALARARADAAAELGPQAERAFARIGPDDVALHVGYEPGAPSPAEAFRDALRRHRTRDRARRSATVGPHRDDLTLDLGGIPVRGMASQGQQRAVVLALELAEIEVIEQVRGVRPVLLLDDVSSELDRQRTRSLLAALESKEGQVILTTTRPELIDEVEPGGRATRALRRDFRVEGGRISAASA